MSSTNVYHVIMRGNNKSYIFKSDADKDCFLKILLMIEEEGLIETLAWCLMDNHVHIVLYSDGGNLAIAMKRINTKYAIRYNHKHKQIGHVFQDRFKSDPVETDVYLMQVTRYVHNNPVKAKMVGKPELYKWSSYNDYLNKQLTNLKSFLFSLFDNKVIDFINYHNQYDYQEYLEIVEDQEKYRMERAQKIITDLCNKYGVVEAEEIHNNEKIKTEIILSLFKRSGLSMRGISRLTDIGFSSVQNIVNRYKNLSEHM